MSNLSLDNAAELRDFFFAIMESLPTGLLLADEDGRLLALNQRARVILDLPNFSLLGRPCRDIIEQGLGVSKDQLTDLGNHGRRVICNVSSPDNGAEKRIIAIMRNDLQSPFLNVGGFLLSLEDVTHLAIMEAQEERQQRFAALQEVAVNLTQELKNPLGSLELYISLLKRDLAGDPESDRILSQMVLAVRSMDHLLDNYVTMARQPAAGPGQVHVSDWLEQTAEQLRILAPRVGCIIRCIFGHEKEKIAGDLKLLHQMSLNLGLNGLESMPQGGTLDISTREVQAVDGRPPFLQISFADQGNGIPVDFREKVFDPFFSTKDRAHGLGLAIVHHVVQAHHGLVQLADHSGRGTVFTVLLPREVCC